MWLNMLKQEYLMEAMKMGVTYIRVGKPPNSNG